MRILPLATAAFVTAAVVWQPGPGDVTVIVTSTLEGNLTPCGCTKPMSGGIKRRATVVRRLSAAGPTVTLDSGGWINASGRQDEMKVEALAETLRQTGVNAALWGMAESRLGGSIAATATRLSEGRLVTTSVVADPEIGLNRWIDAGPFLVGGIALDSVRAAENLRSTPVSTTQALADLKIAAEELGLAPALLIEGGRDQAAEMAKAEPSLALVVYRLQGTPPETLDLVGNTALVSAGDLGRKVVALTYSDGKFKSVRVIDLGPDVEDDEEVSRTHSRYLARVSEAGLLDRLPRGNSAGYVGSQTCGSCHGEALDAWKATRHSNALVTLEHEGHDKDPDCVGCHVTGLDDESGFRSREKTPLFSSVGCESCHGPGGDHVKEPAKFKLRANGAQSCLPCHTSTTSPGFDFENYWARVIHK